MKLEIYCDESGVEALSDIDAHKFVGIGGVWMPAEFRSRFKVHMNEIRNRHKLFNEYKWQKVSPNRIGFYEDIIHYFFSSDYLKFRTIIIESSKVDNKQFHLGDSELGFYKFYYQLLHHWIYDLNEYDIFVDHKINRDKGRLKKLFEILKKANFSSKINFVQGLPSEQSEGIQLADLLTGLVTSKFNGEITGEAKSKLIKEVEEKYLQGPIQPTFRDVEKFNVFAIKLSQSW